jgi:predicted AlkP superfamily pyrophosphatase or phosphodiesterase
MSDASREGSPGRRLSRAGFLGTVGASAATLVGLPGTARATGSLPTSAARPTHLVIISMDAFRADYRSLVDMKNLEALAAGGTSFDTAWVGHLSSDTPASHTTIGTGVFPRRHGILGFEWRDPTTGKEVLDGWSPGVQDGYMERDLKAANTDSIAAALKRKHSNAVVVAASSEKVYAALGMGGPRSDFVLYSLRDTKVHELVPAALTGHRPPASFFARTTAKIKYPVTHFTDWDYLSRKLAVSAFKSYHPTALLVNLPGADIYGHSFGGPDDPIVMSKVIKGLDRAIGAIVTAYRSAGLFDQTLFVITADHGMVPNDRFVGGKTIRQAVEAAGGKFYFHTGGTAAFIYIHNPETAAQVATSVARIPNVTGSYYLTKSATGYAYMPAPGVAPLDSELADAHAYLLGTFACGQAPDVLAQYRENTIGRKMSVLYGYHGGMNWGAQAIPMIFSGPGVNRGAISHHPARLVDVASTALRTMGLSLTEHEGIVLADALTDATADEKAAQVAIAPSLTANVTALKARSAADIADDLAQKIKPPAPRPDRP